MPAEETKQTEKTPETAYDLSPAERMLFVVLNDQAKTAKVKIYELNVQLEIAQKERDQAEARFAGALAGQATAKELKAPVTISPDFTRIEGAK